MSAYPDWAWPRFRCAICRRHVPAELGAWDDIPDACDDCWLAVHIVREVLIGWWV